MNTKIRNIETGKEFETIFEAAKWAMITPAIVKTQLDTGKPAGLVPDTMQPAHWESV